MVDENKEIFDIALSAAPSITDYTFNGYDPSGVPVLRKVTWQTIRNLFFSTFSTGSSGDAVVNSGGTPVYVNQDFSFTGNFGDLKSTTAYTGGTVFSIEVPYNCVIEAIRMKGSSTAGAVAGAGTATLDIYKSTYATFPSMGTAQSIFGTATKPNLTGTATYENTSLTGYTTTLTKGDWLTFVMVNSGFVWTSVAISGRKTAVS